MAPSSTGTTGTTSSSNSSSSATSSTLHRKASSANVKSQQQQQQQQHQQRPSSAGSHHSQVQVAQQQDQQQQQQQQHAQGSITRMEELYEVGEVIGTGTFGIIRKVIRRSDGLILARKELDYGRMDERDLKQLSEEVNILQNLEPNENIVRYYERYVDRQKYRLHIIMEYCHNGDLAAQIQRCRRKNTLVREEVIWSYLAQIAQALSDCHAEFDAKGRSKQVILHRDIKPENVFLDKDGILKLGDFGLSKAMANAAFTNTYVGTPYYMSPELINGQAYDQKSDIWALGCLIYELCAWHPPFHEARTQAELTKLIRDGRIPNMPSVYSRNLQETVKSMLRQDPKHRPTVAQIKNMEEVKLQFRVIEMRKMHDELMKARREVDLRETAVAERERQISVRERDLELERNELQNERLRLAAAFSSLTTAYQSSSSSSGASYTGTSTAPSSRDTSPLMDQKENTIPSINAVGVPFPDDMSMINVSDSATKTLARVASRPSLVPRRPLEERRSMIGLNSLAKRMSCQSLQSMAIDGETPVKSNLSTPNTEARRRIATSKSMHNLKSSGGSRHESPTSRAFPSSLAMQRNQYTSQQQHTPTSVNSGTSGTFPPSRPASSSAVEGPSSATRRSDSVASLGAIHPSVHERISPSKRPMSIARTSTAPPQLSSAASMSSISSYATLTHHGLPAPKWNLDDEDTLPSPFIKKKISTGPLRAMAMAHAQQHQQHPQASTISGATMNRAYSSTSISSSTIAGSGSAAGRVTRAAAAKQSLASRLAMHRQVKVDEQGRRTAA